MAHIEALIDLPVGLRNATIAQQLCLAGLEPSLAHLATLSPYETSELCARAQTRPALVKVHLVSAAETRAQAELEPAESALTIRRPKKLRDILAAIHPALASDVLARFLVEAVGMPTPADEVRTIGGRIALKTQVLDYAREGRVDLLIEAIREAETNEHETIERPTILQSVVLKSRIKTVLEALLAGTSPSRAWAAVARSQCRARSTASVVPVLPDTPQTPSVLGAPEEDVKPNLAGLGILPIDQPTPSTRLENLALQSSTPSRKRGRGEVEPSSSNGRASSDPSHRQRVPSFRASDDLITLVISGLPTDTTADDLIGHLREHFDGVVSVDMGMVVPNCPRLARAYVTRMHFAEIICESIDLKPIRGHLLRAEFEAPEPVAGPPPGWVAPVAQSSLGPLRPSAHEVVDPRARR